MQIISDGISKLDLNIVLITIDCWRFDYFSSQMTPNIYKLSLDSFRFDSAYANGPWTPPSVSSFMTSTYPFMYTDYCPIPPQKKTLAEILKENGYYNFCINSNIFLSKYFGFNRGFDEYIETRPKQSIENFFIKIRDKISSIFPKDGRVLRIFAALDRLNDSRSTLESEIKINAGELVLKAMQIWKKTGRKKFAWLHFMDCHAPLNPAIDFIKHENSQMTTAHLVLLHKYHRMLNRVSDYEPITSESKMIYELMQLYTASLKYVDAEIGKLLKYLALTGEIQKTIIVITSDHGELFMEHGFMEHPARMFDELLHVPLILHLPSTLQVQLSNPKAIPTDIDLINLSPTLLDLIGLQPPSSFCGHSLVSLFKLVNGQRFYPIISQTYKKRDNRKTIESNHVDRLLSIQDSHWKFILDTHNGDAPKLFKRLPFLDENRDVASEYPEIVNNFKNQSNAILSGTYGAIKYAFEGSKIQRVISKLNPIF